MTIIAGLLVVLVVLLLAENYRLVKRLHWAEAEVEMLRYDEAKIRLVRKQMDRALIAQEREDG